MCNSESLTLLSNNDTRYDKVKDDIPKIRRDTAKARVQDVSNTIRNIEALIRSMSYRVGVEGFFCIVRSSTNFYMGPQWYFTSDALRQYMPLAVRRKWDTSEVGTRLEAFALAGCDTMNLLQNNQQKVAFLKNDIRDRILDNLVSATGQSNIRMDYRHHEESIVLKHGVELVGWTCDRFINPSELSSSIVVLTTLRDAIRDGVCKFIKLTHTQHMARQQKWDADVAAGKIIPRSRSKRSDIGKKRKATAQDSDEENKPNAGDNDANNDPSIEEPADKPITTSSAAEPSAKRCKTAPANAHAPKPKAGQKQLRDSVAKEKTHRQGKGQKNETVRALLRLRQSRAAVADDEDDEEAPRAPSRLRKKSRAIIEDDEDDEVIDNSAALNDASASNNVPNTVPADMQCIDPLLLTVRRRRAIAELGDDDDGDPSVAATSVVEPLSHFLRLYGWVLRADGGGSSIGDTPVGLSRWDQGD
ncbi:hypothetical protein K438DRAFT_1788100 [Mycena galopus ATCC 62051]|nr:hypothetical protein K438DRAFT_1788100 [Mycena galopus ATCC 62051]